MRITAFTAMAAIGAALLFGSGCENAYDVVEADPIPPTNFLPHHELLKRQKASFPFNRLWYKDNCDWKRFNKLKFDNVDISHMMKQDWWQNVSETKAPGMRDEAKGIGSYMRNAFVKEVIRSPGHELSVVEMVDEHTAVVQLALVQLVPTKAFFNAAGTVAGFFIPGASLVNVVNSGSVAMECKVFDGRTGELIFMCTARENDEAAIINLNGLTWYGNAKNTIDHWAGSFAELATRSDTSNLKKEFPFSIISLPK